MKGHKGRERGHREGRVWGGKEVVGSHPQNRKGLLGGDKQTALDPNTKSQVCYLIPLNISPSHSKRGALRVRSS